VPLWKKILLRSLGFGAGFAVVLCVAAGIFLWNQGRPKPPKPWSRQAVTAEYDFASTDDDNKIFFYYTVQNNTESDYRLDSDSQVELAVRLKTEKAFDSSGKVLTLEYPVFIPAKGRARVKVKIPQAYPEHDRQETSDELYEHRSKVAKYVAKEATNLDGFVLFDTTSKYEIDFPSGWEKESDKK
jgi:hypothetical protein